MASGRLVTEASESVRDGVLNTQHVNITLNLHLPPSEPGRALDAAERALDTAYHEMLGVLRARAREYAS